MYSPDAKFEEHRVNNSRDILDWVLYCFIETTYDIITLLYLQKRKYLKNKNRYCKKKNAICLYFERPFK